MKEVDEIIRQYCRENEGKPRCVCICTCTLVVDIPGNICGACRVGEHVPPRLRGIDVCKKKSWYRRLFHR